MWPGNFFFFLFHSRIESGYLILFPHRAGLFSHLRLHFDFTSTSLSASRSVHRAQCIALRDRPSAIDQGPWPGQLMTMTGSTHDHDRIHLWPWPDQLLTMTGSTYDHDRIHLWPWPDQLLTMTGSTHDHDRINSWPWPDQPMVITINYYDHEWHTQKADETFFVVFVKRHLYYLSGTILHHWLLVNE